MGMVRYSILAAVALTCAQGLASSNVSAQASRSGASTSQSSNMSKMDHARKFEDQYRDRLSRLRRLQQIASENRNSARLKKFDQLYDRLEKSHQTRLEATSKPLSGRARQDFLERMKSGRDGRAWQRASTLKQNRREHARGHPTHEKRAENQRKHHQEQAERDQRHHQERAERDQLRHQKRAERDQQRHQDRAERDHIRHQNNAQKQHARQSNARERHDKLRNRHADRTRGMERKRGQKDQLRDHKSDRKQLHRQNERHKGNTSSRRDSSKRASGLRSQRDHDTASRKLIHSGNAKDEFEKLLREIESDQ